MATENGAFRQGFFATIAAADTAIDSFIDAVAARLLASSGASPTRIVISVSLSVECNDGGGNTYTHRLSFTGDTGTVAAPAPVTNAKAMVTAFDTFADAVEAASTYTTVDEVTVTATVNASN